MSVELYTKADVDALINERLAAVYTKPEVDKLIADAKLGPPPPPPPASPVPTGPPGTWTLRFQDEFDGTALDTSKWAKSWFNGGTMNNVATDPANVAVSGGNLILTLSSNNRGALVSTNPNDGVVGGYTFTTGVVEARCFFPGNGTNLYNWPAWWTDGQNWPANGENDIAEVLGPGVMTSHFVCTGRNDGITHQGYWGGAWHTYTLHRKATSTDMYFDGALKKTFVNLNDGNAPHFLILNIGAGQGPTMLGAQGQFKVDYVRAWV